jgi:hypothetical protein
MANLAIRSATPASSFPSQGTVIDRAGLKVDATGGVWALNHAVDNVRLDFRKLKFRSLTMLEATAKFIADMIKVSSVDHTQNTFHILCCSIRKWIRDAILAWPGKTITWESVCETVRKKYPEAVWKRQTLAKNDELQKAFQDTN